MKHKQTTQGMFNRFIALEIVDTGDFPEDVQRYLVHSNKICRDIDRASTTKQCRHKYKHKIRNKL